MPCPTGQRPRSACSSSAASGRRTSRSMAALPIRTCRSGRSAIPTRAMAAPARACCSAAYVFDSPYAYEFTALPPEDRLKKAVEYGAQIHPQYQTEYENGIAVGWHRVPWALGCFGRWTDEARKQHYRESLRHRRADRAGRRARLPHSGLAGGRGFVLARRDLAPAPARVGELRAYETIEVTLVMREHSSRRPVGLQPRSCPATP